MQSEEVLAKLKKIVVDRLNVEEDQIKPDAWADYNQAVQWKIGGVA